jgi:predicted DNA-binding transcriptional regulator AlpA
MLTREGAVCASGGSRDGLSDELSRLLDKKVADDENSGHPSRPDAAGRQLDDLGDVLLLPEVAAVLRTSTRTVKRHLRAATFPIPTLPGIDKRVRFAKADVEQFLRGGHKVRRGSL